MLLDGDFELVQSNAILRYLARKHGRPTVELFCIFAFQSLCTSITVVAWYDLLIFASALN